MKVLYFPDTDTALIQLSDGEVHETREINENLYLDLDKDGNVVSITVEHARKLASITEFSFLQMEEKPA